MRNRSMMLGALAALTLFSGGHAAAQAAGANVFSGAPAEIGTLPNGGLMNKRTTDQIGRRGGEIVDVSDGLWVLRNYSIVNCIVVETAAGLVVMDSGTTRADGLNFLKLIRSRTNKPILAIIYSHNHYTGGAKALIEGAGNPDVVVIGHPKLEANFEAKSLAMHASTTRRANMQFGLFLPKRGPDAAAGIPSTTPASPEERVPQHVPVSKSVVDGETLKIGGTDFTFYHAQGDTDDTLTVWIPGMKAVITNVISDHFMAMYTLRGQPFRDPQGIIDSYSRIRDLEPEYYVQTHGAPVIGKAEIHKRMQLHHDAYSYTYNQAIRGINLGWSPEEIVERTPLPARFRDEPSLIESYSEYEFALRGIYSGLMGWFAEDTAALHPPTPARLGKAVETGFGGRARLLDAARAAQQRKEYDLAAVLAGYAVAADPRDMAARQVKADALRSMAQVSTATQSHNFYLAEALELEGKIDTRAQLANGFGGFGWETVVGQPPETLVSVLESRIAPERSRGVDASFVLVFTDAPQRYRVDIRDAVAEVRPAADGDSAPVLALPMLALSRRDWFDIMTGKTRLADAAAAGKAKVSGAGVGEIGGLLAMFDPF